MTLRCVSCALRVAAVVCAVFLTINPSWAQDENETVGFRANHIFESGGFGENLDILNGGLNLTVPIGQRYQVSSRLGYSLSINYNSKIWDSNDHHGLAASHERVLPRNEGPFGIGFSLHFGRIFNDPQEVSASVDETENNPGHTVTWYWVSPDGSQHEFFHDSSEWNFISSPTILPEGVTAGPLFTLRQTNDLSYAYISGPDDKYCYGLKDDGMPEKDCFRVLTPDGLVYTLVNRMDCANPDPPSPGDPQYGKNRADNLSYCGWYTTLIEDPSVGRRSVDPTDGRILVPYPHHVTISYESGITRSGFEHAIDSVTDSVGRSMQFHNCEWATGSCSATTSTACNVDGDCPGSERCDPVDTDVSIQDLCLEGSKSPNSWTASDRSAVAAYSVDMPAFGGNSTALDPTKRAVYNFMYEYGPVRVGNAVWENCDPTQYSWCTCPNGGSCGSNGALMSDSVLKLVRVDYPEHTRPSQGSPDKYSLYYGYDNAYTPDPSCEFWPGKNDDYGQVACRTLPIRREAGSTNAPPPPVLGNACAQTGEWAKYEYSYAYYTYIAAFLSGGRSIGTACQGNGQPGCGNSGSPAGFSLTGQTRQIVSKTIEMPVPSTSPGGTWNYCRLVSSGTNPDKVTVTDPFGNDTVYRYRKSFNSGNENQPGTHPEDGFAPEWDDGLSEKIQYYEGSESSGRLVRTVLQEHDADPYLITTKRSKDNVRNKQDTTRFDDDGGRTIVTTRNDWDDWGNWRSETVFGFDMPSGRTTRREHRHLQYYDTLNDPFEPAMHLTGLLKVSEVSDGVRVLSRSDRNYNDQTGRLETSIDRANPGAIGAPHDMTQHDGDVKTTFTYSTASGNLTQKQITKSPTDSGYTMRYTYAPELGTCLQEASNSVEPSNVCGGYLATKEFLNGGVAPWKAIERARDANTGMIMQAKDTSEVPTTYSYGSLGRITSVTPQGEEPTEIDYVSLLETVVTQGDTNSNDYLSTRHHYDALGRQIATEKQSYDPIATLGPACQTTKYDAEGRVIFKSESWYAQSGCSPGAAGEIGTTISFQETDTSPIDPLGRVRRVIPADANPVTGEKVTETDYFGTSSIVTVNDIMGPGGVSFPSTTTFYKDALGRLLYVDAPSGKRCSETGVICSENTQCTGGAGDTCVDTDGGADAIYTYDAADNLIQVDLADGLTTQTRRFKFDGLGRPEWTDHPENGTTVYTDYDALGNPLELQDAAGNKQTFTYDFAGRLLEQHVQVSGGTPQMVLRNTYDFHAAGSPNVLGKLTKIESFDEDGSLLLSEERTYDGLGARLSSTTHLFADSGMPLEQTDYQYDARGQLTAITYPRETSAPIHSPLTIEYEYSNGYGIRALIGYPAEILSEITYNAAGAIEQFETPGGGRSKMTFDSRNRPDSITTGQWDEATGAWARTDFQSGTYSYDGVGNIHQIGDNTYAYDAANRLVTAHTVNINATNPSDEQAWDEQFTYDAFGNMAHKVTTHFTSGYTSTDTFTHEGFGAPNRNQVLDRGTFPGDEEGLVTFHYDARGNLTEGGRIWQMPGMSQATHDVKRFEYGVLNRLNRVHQIDDPAGGARLTEIGEYGYDAAGNRILKRGGGSALTTYYVRDAAGQVLSEFRKPPDLFPGIPPRAAWTKDYIYIAGRLLSLKENLRPHPPKGLRASQTKTQNLWNVTLYWENNTDPDVSSYLVYRQFLGTGTWSLVTKAYANIAADFGAFSSGDVILYRVVAKDFAQYESEASAILKVWIGDTSGPSKPVLSGIPGDGRITLNWSTSTDDSGVAGYEIWRRPGTPMNATSVAIVNQLFLISCYVDLNLV